MGFEIEDFPNPLVNALRCNSQSIGDFQRRLNHAVKHHCDALITPIFTDNYIQQPHDHFDLDHCYLLSDKHYPKNQINLVFPFINDCLWKLPIQKRTAFFKLVLGYFSYLGIRFFCIKFEEDMMDSLLETLESVKKQLRKCTSNLILIVETNGDAEDNDEKNDKIWRNYIHLRSKLNDISFPLRVQLALVIKPNLCSNAVINRWKSEKVYYLIAESECFVSNPKGFRVLPAKHERISLEFLLLKSTFVFQVNDEIDGDEEFECFKYILHIYRKMAQNKLRSDKEAIRLIDYMQNPLQPYADNLESETYQIFENDEPKYDEYQYAMEAALSKLPKDRTIIVYYIGCGRGGLLYGVFEAAKRTDSRVFVYAIEKNPYPIQTVKKRIKENKWEKQVKIIQTDIKDYEMQDQPDIFISELLGGFGDNELSPECLFWAEKNILPSTICIPQNYISYIRPVSYQEVHRNMPRELRHSYYTVYYGSYYTNFESQEVWKFEHPLPRSPEVFTKHGVNTFIAKQSLVINGFAGYFTTQLQDDVGLSILPERPTLGSYSWFPIFFPFQDAVLLEKDQAIKIEMWRKNEQDKVWYQWQYEVEGKKSVVHNQKGSCIAIQLVD